MAIACAVAIIAILWSTPLFIFPLVAAIGIQIWLSTGYVVVSRDLRRIESNTRSPIIAAFSELVR